MKNYIFALICLLSQDTLKAMEKSHLLEKNESAAIEAKDTGKEADKALAATNTPEGSSSGDSSILDSITPDWMPYGKNGMLGALVGVGTAVVGTAVWGLKRGVDYASQNFRAKMLARKANNSNDLWYKDLMIFIAEFSRSYGDFDQFWKDHGTQVQENPLELLEYEKILAKLSSGQKERLADIIDEYLLDGVIGQLLQLLREEQASLLAAARHDVNSILTEPCQLDGKQKAAYKAILEGYKAIKSLPDVVLRNIQIAQAEASSSSLDESTRNAAWFKSLQMLMQEMRVLPGIVAVINQHKDRLFKDPLGFLDQPVFLNALIPEQKIEFGAILKGYLDHLYKIKLSELLTPEQADLLEIEHRAFLLQEPLCRRLNSIQIERLKRIFAEIRGYELLVNSWLMDNQLATS